MKKLIFTLAFVFALVGFAGSTSAAVCGDPGIVCGNGPIVAQQPGGRFLKPGSEDCPAWFPYSGCYTMRAVNAYFVALR